MLDKLDAALRFQQEALNLRPASGSAGSKHRQCRYPWLSGAISILPVNLKVMQRGRDATSVVALTMTSTQHIPAQALTPPTAELQYRIPDQPSLDGNTVDMIANAPSLPITACNTR